MCLLKIRLYLLKIFELPVFFVCLRAAQPSSCININYNMAEVVHKFDSSNDDICKFGYYRKEYKVYEGFRFGNDGSYPIFLNALKSDYRNAQKNNTCFRIKGELINLEFIIATLFVDNPNNYSFVKMLKPGSYCYKDLEWVEFKPTRLKRKLSDH